jgi:hypothetical protein
LEQRLNACLTGTAMRRLKSGNLLRASPSIATAAFAVLCLALRTLSGLAAHYVLAPGLLEKQKRLQAEACSL